MMRVESEEAGTAPIPAPGDGAERVGGAAPGPQSREAPGNATRRGSWDNAAYGWGRVRERLREWLEPDTAASKAIEVLLTILLCLLMMQLVAPVLLLGW